MKSREVTYRKRKCADSAGRDYVVFNDIEDPWKTFAQLNRALAVYGIEIVIGDNSDFFAFRIEAQGGMKADSCVRYKGLKRTPKA
jgi:hypothetical protein